LPSLLSSVDIDETIEDLLFDDRLRNDLGNVFGLYLEITYLLRINHHDGSSFTKPRASGPFGIYVRLQALLFDLCFEGGDHSTRTGGKTTGTGAY